MRPVSQQLAVAEELARMGSWVFDLESHSTLWSAGMFRILGLSPENGTPDAAEILELFHPEDRGRMQRLLNDVIARPEAVPEAGVLHVVRMFRADGSLRELRAVGKVTYDEAGRAWWLGSAQDITEHRMTERELRAHYAVRVGLADPRAGRHARCRNRSGIRAARRSGGARDRLGDRVSRRRTGRIGRRAVAVLL